MLYMWKNLHIASGTSSNSATGGGKGRKKKMISNWVTCRWLMSDCITNKWIRRILLFISNYVFMDQICEILYPDDLMITFGDEVR